MYLTVTPEVDNTTLKLKFSGVLDYSTVDSFDVMNNAPTGISHIEVDFTDLEFIDSTGIGAVITILHQASSVGASVDFINLSDDTKDLFDTVGLFTIKKSLLNEG